MSRSSVPWRSSVDGILDTLGERRYHCSPRTSRSHRNLEFGIWNLEFAMGFVRTLRGVVFVAAFAVLHADSAAITGRMNIARSGHQATLLMDGRVLASG